MLIAIYNKALKAKGKFMLDNMIVVQSAVSAFNNAALLAPAFLWWGLLAVPLFAFVYKYSGLFCEKLNCDIKNVSVWTVSLIFAWVVLFGGTYNVLRDSLSVLPFTVAMILFLSALFVSSHMRNRPLPRMTWWRILIVAVCVALIGMSDMHVWWGPLLQIGATVLGFFLGRMAKGEMRPVAGTLLIVLCVAIAMLMQPEFFRFGQLGNLTVAHLGAMLVLGAAAMAAVATLNIKSSGKIKRSIFVKLKWLMRVLCALGAALFVITEAVPVFIGTLIAVFIMFALSVWHSRADFEHFGVMMFALVLGTFGVITVMPVITVLGILLWRNQKCSDFRGLVRRLL